MADEKNRAEEPRADSEENMKALLESAKEAMKQWRLDQEFEI